MEEAAQAEVGEAEALVREEVAILVAVAAGESPVAVAAGDRAEEVAGMVVRASPCWSQAPQ